MSTFKLKSCPCEIVAAVCALCVGGGRVMYGRLRGGGLVGWCLNAQTIRPPGKTSTFKDLPDITQPSFARIDASPFPSSALLCLRPC